MLDKGALALVVGMSGTILLLLIGTQILDWYWLVLLTAISLGVGLYRLRGSVPSLYRLAQRIDRRLGLADALSTATHFSANPDRDRQAICDSQRREAEASVARVDVRQAFPYQRSRYLLPALGLSLVAFGLFAVRYVVTGSISLEPSLLKIAYEDFFSSPAEQAKNQMKRLNLVPDPFNPGNPDAPTTKNDLAPQDPLQSDDSANSDNPKADDNSKQNADGKGDQNGEGADKEGDQKNGKEGDQKDGKDGKAGDKDGQQKEGQDKSGKSGENSSMLDKLKDALSDVMNKLKNSGDNAKSSQNKQQQQKQQSDSGQKGQASKEKTQDPGSQATPDSNPDGDKSPADDAKDASQEGKPSNQDAGNGAGKQDGDKTAKEAKMLEAMGKVSELIGKRSATVTGEVMVEVGSTKQELKTAWSQQKANHTEAGSEIQRDEVPLMDQPYVEKYFEEIRKMPAPSNTGKK